MKWNKPKKTVQSILVYLGVISLVITSITSIIIAIWVTYPNAINSFDKKVPDFYASYIKGVYNTTESFENKEVKLVIFKYLYEKLKDYNIYSRRYFYPLVNDFACYKSLAVKDPLTVARKVSERILTLPIYYNLSLDDVERICDILIYHVRNGKK